jgi:hypothetical protein
LAIAKSLDILLRAPTSKLDADLKRANALAKGFFSQFRSLAAAAIGGLTVASVVGRINDAFKTLDATAKRALKLQVDVQEIRGLELAAELSGLAVEKINTSYGILIRNIAAANAGGKQQQQLFQQLGLDAQKLGGMGAADQFQAIAAAIDGIRDRTQKANAAIQLFGRSGLDLLPLMANQGKGIADAMRDAQRLGGFISTAEAGRVEAANDAFSRLTFTVRSLFQRIAVDMAPALGRLFTTMAEGLKPGTALNAMLQTFGSVATLLVNVLDVLLNEIRFLSEFFGVWTGKLLGAIIVSVAVIKIYTTLAALLTILRLRTIALAAVEAARLALQKKNIAAALLVAGLGVAAFAAFSDEINKLVDGLLGAADAQADLNQQVGDFEKLQAKAGGGQKLNLGSAQFGTQAALEQILTVRGEQRGIAQVAAGVDQSNELLGQIRDGINAAQGIVGGFDLDEAGL